MKLALRVLIAPRQSKLIFGFEHSCSLSLRPLQSFAAHDQCLNGSFVAFGGESGSLPLAGPCVEEVPADLLLSNIILEDDRTVLALRLPAQCRHMPVVEFVRIAYPPLQCDVAI